MFDNLDDVELRMAVEEALALSDAARRSITEEQRRALIEDLMERVKRARDHGDFDDDEGGLGVRTSSPRFPRRPIAGAARVEPS